MKITGSVALSLCAIALNAAMPALAQDKRGTQPWIEFKLPAEWQNDYDYSSDARANERNNMSLKLEPEATLNIRSVPGLSFYVHGVLEQVQDAAAREDRYFRDEGFYIQELLVSYSTGRYGFVAGKTNPGFGIAWDQTPGIYGSELAEDYELSERIALSMSAGFDLDGWGQHTLKGGVFFLDTSPLQNTIYSQTRGKLGREDGGVANTEDFSSYNIVLEGGFPSLPGFLYHLGFVNQAHGVDGTSDETGFAAGVKTRFDLGGGMSLTPMVELVRFDDFGGTRGKDRRYWTGSLLGEWNSWNLALAHTRRNDDDPTDGAVNDHQSQVSVGYTFSSGLTADLGWKRRREGGIHTDTVGFLFTYAYEYSR